MKNTICTLAIVLLSSTAFADTAPPPLPETENQQECGCPLKQPAAQQAIILRANEVTTADLVADAGTVQAGMGSFFAAECCGGGGWGQVGLRSPMLYLSLAFLALLYVGRRSLLRALQRQHLRTA